MLKISGRVKLIFNIIFKLILTMTCACAAMFAMLYVAYRPTYNVKINGESLGYIKDKDTVQEQVSAYLQNGDKENVGYVVLKDEPTYEFELVKKDTVIEDDCVTQKIIDRCDVYYRVYGINVNDEEKFVVETVSEAQEIVDKINDEQSGYAKKADIQISEKFVQKYELLDDVEVAMNDIVKNVKAENDKVVKKTANYAASTKVVPQEILLALKEANADLNFRNPLDNGIVTSRFGIRSLGNHKGMDIAAKTGTPIHVAQDGVVTYVGWYSGYGNFVMVTHKGGYVTCYGHCSAFNCKVGDFVHKGDVIAYVGSTGRSTGPHVHFEIRINDVLYDPEPFIVE